MKILCLSNKAVVKYQCIIHFTIGPHSIHVQVRRDQDKQWFPTLYKLSDAELEAIVVYWPIEWREPVSIQDVWTGPPVNAPVDHVPDIDQ